MTERVAPDEARAALEAVADARRRVADEVGLPRAYWWGMAAGWLGLGLLGEFAPTWVASAATFLFGAGHSAIASRLLDGRRRTSRMKVSADVASRRVPAIVIGMLLALVALTIGLALLLDADGADHPQIWTSGMVALVIGFGGAEILSSLRRIFRA